MGHIKREHLSRALCAVPQQELITTYGEAIGPLINRQAANAIESRTLADLRDTLLPKLISGEIRVPDVERAAGSR